MHGVIMVAVRNRRGKKRRSSVSAARHRRAPVDYRATVAAQPHRCWLPESLRAHERASDVLGCLNLLKRISEHEYEAGRRYGVIVAAYRQAIGTPKGTIGNGRGYPCEPSACAKAGGCECQDRTARYRDATRALILAGQRAYNATYQVVVQETIPTREQLADLCCGLRALERFLGLSGRKT